MIQLHQDQLADAGNERYTLSRKGQLSCLFFLKKVIT